MESLYWLIGIAVLVFIEILTLGLTTIWFAGGALVAFIASLFNVSIGIQIALFLVVSLLLLIFTRPIAIKHLNKDRTKTNYEGLVGKIVIITEKVDNLNQTGAGEVQGQEWTVRSQEDSLVLEKGTRAQVVKIEGVKLIVKEYKEGM